MSINEVADADSRVKQYDEAALQIAREYSAMIEGLARLTSQLPERLRIEFQGLREDSVHTIDIDHGTIPEMASMAFHNDLRGNGAASMDSEIVAGAAKQDDDGYFKDDCKSQQIEEDVCTRQTSASDAMEGRKFYLKNDWERASIAEDDSQLEIAQLSVSKSKQSLTEANNEDYLLTESVTGVFRHFVAPPTNNKRVTWELFGTFLVVYDMIAIPLVAAFTPPANYFVDTMDWVALIYWSLNVPVVLTTGLISKGVLILSPRTIFMQYARTWMAVDAVTLLPDWFFTVMNFTTSRTNAGGYVKLLRAVRLVRLARLLRLVKLHNAYAWLHDALDSEAAGISLDVVRMVVLLMLVNHYVACFWFLVGSAQRNGGWMKAHGFTRPEVDWGEQYVVAYHWSITQFTPSSMNVQPATVNERVFAVITLIFALVGFSYLVGSITGNLTRLRAMGEKRQNLFWHLRKFLNKTGVPADLGLRIKSYVESRWAHQQDHMKQSSVALLDLLSAHLKGELASALHGPALCIHPLFNHLEMQVALTIQRLALTGLSDFSLAPHDVMFVAGEAATHMTFVTVGILEYKRMHMGQDYPEIVMSNEDWIAEPVLWARSWHYLGDLKAKVSTELLNVSPESVIHIMHRNPVAYKIARAYASAYCQWLNNWSKQKLSDISQGEDVSEELERLIEQNTPKLPRKSTKVSGLVPFEAARKPGMNKLYQRSKVQVPPSKKLHAVQ